MKLLKWLLFPFTLLYAFVMRIRNHLYNIGYYKSFQFQTNVISVGNLTVGGTGKTPMVEYLINLLKDDFRVSTLSRGYGRKTRGFRKGDLTNTQVKDIGDEPFQYLLKYNSEINVFVGEERAWAIPNILMEEPDTEIILLDDAYQHRTVKPSLNIVLSRYDQLFYDDYILPMGRLREPRKEINRADIVVITKCPENMHQDEIRQNVEKYYASNLNLFFTKVNYAKLIHFFSGEILSEIGGHQIIILSGLANAIDFESYLKKIGEVKTHLKFGDHHRYTRSDIDKINSFNIENDFIFVTTEKDFVKLREFEEELRDLPLYYLPIEIEFLDNKSKFDQLIRQSIQEYDMAGNNNE